MASSRVRPLPDNGLQIVEYGLYQGDCVDGMSLLPADSIHLVLTSPPYDDLRTYEDKSEWSFDKFRDVADEISRVLMPGGVCVWVVGDQTINGSETLSSFRQALYFKDDCGLFAHDTMIYQKPGASHPASRDGNRYTPAFEYMFVFSKGKPRTANLICDVERAGWGVRWGKGRVRKADGDFTGKAKRKDKYADEPLIPRSNIWYIKNSSQYGQRDKRAYEHPATYPEELASGHIRTWTNPGDVVLDPFTGSGTTMRMAEEHGRNFLGFEINETYCELAESLHKKPLFVSD